MLKKTPTDTLNLVTMSILIWKFVNLFDSQTGNNVTYIKMEFLLFKHKCAFKQYD